MSHRRIVAPFAPLLLACAAAAQFTPEDLLAKDWQKRNEAARALAQQAPDVKALCQVLETEWDEWLPTFGLYGGGAGGRFPPKEPRMVTLKNVRDGLVRRQQSPLTWYHGVESLDDLVYPCHPHELVRLILQQHPDTRNDRAPIPTTIERARVWLQLKQPEDELVEKCCLEQRTSESLVCALWLGGEQTRDQLRRLLVGDNQDLRRAALALGQTELFDAPARIDVVVQQLCHGERTDDYSHAGYLLRQLGRAAAAPLARAIGDERIPRSRAVGILALLGADAAPAAEALARVANADRITRRRALIALSDLEIPAPLRSKVARTAWQVFEERDYASKLLALDALGNCGDGVDAALRTKLRAAIAKPPTGGIKARLLGCVRDLGIATDLTTAEKAYIATTIHANTSTYLAVADDGADAAPELARLLLDPAAGIDTEAVAGRFAQTAPHALRSWLDKPEPRLRVLALKGLRTLGDAAGVSSERLVELMDTRAWLANTCVAWLRERPDATAFVPQVVAFCEQLESDHLADDFTAFLTDVDLPFAQKLSLYEPLLRRGIAWQTLRRDELDASDRALLRKEAERLLDAAEGTEVRNRLLSVLVRIGVQREQDIELARQVLRSDRNYPVMWHLDDAPELPGVLRAELHRILSTPEDEDGMPSTDAWYAREILRKHAQR